ncbi:hypothetical protein DPMN_003507 [Dreissena polymorpha]|uniref:Uncharacterized protein n=1 Tax=Dreissena polymorpha TaxID=45954 RepID=A0A9D4RUZ7_DREPO|nr:hypothetical protein DPMN_003507 [Dreissena polymorpha]
MHSVQGLNAWTKCMCVKCGIKCMCVKCGIKCMCIKCGIKCMCIKCGTKCMCSVQGLNAYKHSVQGLNAFELSVSQSAKNQSLQYLETSKRSHDRLFFHDASREID